MQCALCLKVEPLRESHILPEFLYESLYDSKHRLQVLSTAPDVPNLLKQKGLKETLLCDGCEQNISVWEGYARKVIRGELPLTMTGSGSLIYIDGLDYKSFKLFQLSILWRASASKLRFFERVSLGPHQEKLRSLLVNGDPGSPDRYACVMFGIMQDDGQIFDDIVQPKCNRASGQVTYSFIFGGFHWAYFVSSLDTPIHLRAATLREDGSTIIQKHSSASMTELQGFYEHLAELGRA